jgi:hypothetical protein
VTSVTATPPAVASKPSGAVHTRRRKQALLAYLLILPAMALFGVL